MTHEGQPRGGRPRRHAPRLEGLCISSRQAPNGVETAWPGASAASVATRAEVRGHAR